MIYLFIASFVLILYGTLFPFSFQIDAHSGGILVVLVNSLSERPGGGDLISNVILFLPFGFLGMQSLPARMPLFVRYALVFTLGTVTSFAIEFAQYYTTMRTTSLYDLGLNAISVLLGAAVGGINWDRFVANGTAYDVRPPSIFPIIAIAAWAGYRLFPFVPTIDFQHVKDAIKPLLTDYPVPIADIIRHFGMVLGLALLLPAIMSPAKAKLALVLMALGVIAAKPFIVTKVISPAEVFGTVAALALWLTVLGRMSSRPLIVMSIFAAALAFQGLTPFQWRTDPEAFSFILFSGFEQGSMAVNLQAFLEKVFLYGTLIWLVIQAGSSTRLSVSLVVVFTATIEIAQRYVVGRSPEITDPILALLMGGVLLTLERHHRITSRSEVYS